MSTFRVIKDKNFTVISNHHLRNNNLSLKAKGLLSLMLSLPEEWDYTQEGFAAICKDGISSIRSALKELEDERYLITNRLRDDKGQLRGTEYVIYELPHEKSIDEEETDFKDSESVDFPCNKPICENRILDENKKCDEPICENPRLEKPRLEKLRLEKPILENRRQINKDLIINIYLLLVS